VSNATCLVVCLKICSSVVVCLRLDFVVFNPTLPVQDGIARCMSFSADSLMIMALFVACECCRVEDHGRLPHCSPLLKKSALDKQCQTSGVRQVAPPEWR
jgi:hypothetical protein